MHIRPEKQQEFQSLYELIKTAFATAPVADGDEQNFVDRLRAGQAYVPELALVAEQDTEKVAEEAMEEAVERDTGRLVGHIMLTKTPVQSRNGTWDILLLAPLCVVLEERGKGVGSALLRESCKRAVDLGFTAVAVVGDPAYYGRFGFVRADRYAICYESIPPEYVMVLELIPGALAGRNGAIQCEAAKPRPSA